MPAATPAIIPDVNPAVAIVVFPLVQVPPPIVLLSVVVDATQTDVNPLIGPGAELTVMVDVATQPVPGTV